MCVCSQKELHFWCYKLIKVMIEAVLEKRILIVAINRMNFKSGMPWKIVEVQKSLMNSLTLYFFFPIICIFYFFYLEQYLLRIFYFPNMENVPRSSIKVFLSSLIIWVIGSLYSSFWFTLLTLIKTQKQKK